MERLFHITDPADWPAAGEYRPASLAAEGFVHCSFAGQVAGSAARHFPGRAGLVVVELDAAQVGPVRVENGFPHVYGPIPVSAAVAVHDLAAFSAGTAPGGPGR